MCRPTKRSKPVEAPIDPSFLKALESSVNNNNHTEEHAGIMMPSFGDVKEMGSLFDDFSFLMPKFEEVSSEEGSPLMTTTTSVIAPPAAPVLKKEESKQQPKTFVFTCYDILMDKENQKAIRFTAKGNGVEVLDAQYLADYILPHYFRHKNVTSFYRQLNSYGFRTARSSPGISHTFVHEVFHRDHPERLGGILRKKCMMQLQAAQAAAAAEDPTCAAVAAVAPVVTTKPAVMEPSSDVSPQMLEMIHELRELEQKQMERAKALEELNQLLRKDNARLVEDGDKVFRQVRGLVEKQTEVLRTLVGATAAEAFEAQARPEMQSLIPVLPVKSMTEEEVSRTNYKSVLELPGDDQLVLPDQDLMDLETLMCFEDL